MGGGASVPSFTAQDVAAQVKDLGAPYHGYALKIEENGVDGAFLDAISLSDLPDLFKDLEVTSMLHKKKLELVFKGIKGEGGGPQEGVAMPSNETKEGKEEKSSGGVVDLRVALKKYAGFLSHFKLECGTEARLVQQNLKAIVEKNPIGQSTNEIFLDSDDLSDLRNLLQHVRETQVLVLLLSKRVLTRPWVIVELYTAITSGVPIVALNVQNANPYSYSDAIDYLMKFDEELDIANPGAAQMLIDLGVDPVDVAWRLSDCIPNIISTDFNPNASEKVLQASLEDLADAMRKAQPIETTNSKEDFLEKRKSYKPAGSDRQAHGSTAGGAASAGGGAADAAVAKNLAAVPGTVPELPDAYLVRPSDLQQLKDALLEGSAALTSKGSGKKKNSKVGAHGMGGVGKTTIAAALVNDAGVRAAYEKICWVSLGQEPDIPELQNIVHHQLTDKGLPETAQTDLDVSAALRSAAKGVNVLMVLDDVWDAKHEKPLNLLDPDNASRLLVTTRIRGLLKNSDDVELGLLSQAEALTLLLSTAGIEEAEAEEGSDARRLAIEIAELCGNLPLTLGIAGGMISDNPDGISEELVDLMKEDKLREQDDEDAGMSLEERIISTSLKQIKGRNKELVETVFKLFAIFPEDVAVPAGFFNVISSLIIGEKDPKKLKRQGMEVGKALGMLLKYNLIKGSLSSGSGVLMHDIVRDYVVALHSKEELRDLQRGVVNAILEARPKDGFPLREFTSAYSFVGYVSRSLHVHFRGALDVGADPPDEWLAHEDQTVKAQAAQAIGLEGLRALCDSREAAGEKVRAAYASYSMSFIAGLSGDAKNDAVSRAADNLEAADDSGAFEFERGVLMYFMSSDFGSERHDRSCKRMEHLRNSLGDNVTWESKFLEMGTLQNEYFAMSGMMGGDVQEQEILKIGERMNEIYVEACEFEEVPIQFKDFIALQGLYFYGLILFRTCYITPNNHFQQFSNFNEADSLAGLKAYSRESHGALYMKVFHFDCFLQGCFMPVLSFRFGSITEAVDLYASKALACLEDIDLPSTKDFATQAFNICDICWYIVPWFIMIERPIEAASFMAACGFTWGKSGFGNFEAFLDALSAILPIFTRENENANFRLLIYLTTADNSLDAAVNEWIPSPKKIAEMERDDLLMKRMGIYELCSFGARAFLKLGRDDDAYELSRLAILPEQKVEKISSLVCCHGILGQVAATRGDLGEADGHFANALKEAKRSCLPLLEVMAAREWKRHLLAPNQRDCGAAEAVIDAACAKMNKTREQLASLLT